MLESTKIKRIKRTQAQSKATGISQPKVALINESGLVRIEVDFEHCSKIAESIGFQTTQVTHALKEDNDERATVLFPMEESNQSSENEEEGVGTGLE